MVAERNCGGPLSCVRSVGETLPAILTTRKTEPIFGFFRP
jgi:hypothetical protein